MQSRWGDEFDEELKEKEKKHQVIKVGFVFNYMQMSRLLKRIEEETGEWDDKYPKSELLKIWGSAMFILFLLFILSYSILIIATGLFYFFYGHILIQVYGVWKRFKYSGAVYWGMTIVTLIASVGLSWFLRGLLFG